MRIVNICNRTMGLVISDNLLIRYCCISFGNSIFHLFSFFQGIGGLNGELGRQGKHGSPVIYYVPCSPESFCNFLSPVVLPKLVLFPREIHHWGEMEIEPVLYESREKTSFSDPDNRIFALK